MTVDLDEKKKSLLSKITDKRSILSEYIRKAEPKNSFLITSSIVCGAVAAALTAGPGIGGANFIGQPNVSLALGLPLWQWLCLMASLMSIIAVIANGMLKFNNLTGKITQARINDAKLEGLETKIEFDQIDLDQATKEFTECISDMAQSR